MLIIFRISYGGQPKERSNFAGASFQIGPVVLGVAALVATNPGLLTLIKWFEVAYLVCLGIDALHDASHTTASSINL